jgi:hypothetical protein
MGMKPVFPTKGRIQTESTLEQGTVKNISTEVGDRTLDKLCNTKICNFNTLPYMVRMVKLSIMKLAVHAA